MLFSAGMYIFNNEFVALAFIALGYPVYIIYPLATAKILGLIAIHTPKLHKFKALAYSGFFFTTILAVHAHIMVGDNGYGAALFSLVMAIVSYIMWKKLNN